MSLAEQIEAVRQSKARELEDDPHYESLAEFFFEMKKQGFVKEPKYDLPQVDTLGRRTTLMRLHRDERCSSAGGISTRSSSRR